MRNKRCIRRLTSLALILGILAIVATQLGWSYQAEPAYAVVRVQAGDTIWHLASQAAPQEEDVRYVVHDIMKSNHLRENEDIYPGQTIKVPVYGKR